MLKLLWSYIKQHLVIALMFLIFCCIFGGIFSLYNLETEAVIYASVLCFLTGLFFFFTAFIKFYRKHQKLIRLSKNVNLLEECLPDSRGILEADYQELVNMLRGLNNSYHTSMQTWRNESIEYYMTWAHQIKTPISVMRMILQSEDTPEHEELLFELFRIEQYVEMVLSYFRLDSTANDFVIQEYNLNDIMKQVIRKCAPQFIRKQIRLIYNEVDISVLTDEKWLCFIIEQILSNAIKYTSGGTVTISTDKNKTLSISDTGIGIAAEDIPRIFERGFTGYNGRADKKSTGLGLYLCKQAADKLSHTLSVQSAVGKGTTVYVHLKADQLEIE